MAKKLSKILWFGAENDASGKPIIPPLAPSVEKHLEGLNEGELYIHNDDEYPAIYIRTNKDKIVAIGGVDALMKYFLRKDQPDTAKEVITFEKGLEVGDFSTGASGAALFKDLTTGQTIMELDKLYVRMKAYFETLTIIEAETIAGKQIVSPAGSVRCTAVEEYDDYYRCYFLNEQDGEKIENKFIEGDQAYSQMFNAKMGTSNKISNRYYWRLVVGVGEDYIDLSKTDCDAGSDDPMVGDILNQRGHRYPENSERMNFIETSTVDGFSPSITLFHGVNSFSLDGKAYVQFGVDKTTNKAFMNVYGDMYVGDRSQTAYIRYTQEGGLEICGRLAVGTKLGDKDLQELIDSATPEGYQEFVDKVTQDIEGLQNQIDGAIDSYFFQYDPSLDNYPASEWDTESEKKAHLNDTFTNLIDGRSWRWAVSDGVYSWVEITDTATTKALALAGKAQDTADGKRRVFVDTPHPPYDKGDLWSRGSNYPLMVCVVPKASGVYAEGDFDYADNNAKLKEEMQTLVTDTKSELNNSIGQAKEAANKYADEGIASAKEDINASISELEKAKANVTEVYSKSEADGKISAAEQAAIDAAKKQADAAIALSEITVKAYADGIVTDEEEARIKQAKENLAEAKAYAEEQAKAAKNEIENSYLFQALQDAQSTEIENGLVLTSLIQLRDTSSNIMSGINGLINANKGDKSIATWWGGGMYDLLDYYTWNGTQWVVKSGLTPPSNIPSGLIRMDGTGYLANGKFWWDETGKIYADPTALFLSFDVEAEAGTLSSTILDIRDKQTEFSNMWSLEEDSNGTKYLYSKYPLVSQGGVTMYAGTSGLDIEGIYDGLPIDGTTIYWENGVLKAQGGGGGVADSVAWDDVTGKPTFAAVATSGSYNDLLNKPTLLSSFTNDVGFITSSALSGYLPLSGGMIKGVLGINASASPSIIQYYVEGTYYGALGFNAANTPVFRSTNGTEYPILHSGNYTTYTYSKSSIDSKLSGYLPLSGGTITGSLNVAKAVVVQSDNLTVQQGWIQNSIAGRGLYNVAGDARWYYHGTDACWKSDKPIWVNNDVVLHAGNYSSYALPLTGGTLTSSNVPLIINRTGGTANVCYQSSGKTVGYLGFLADGTLIVRDKAQTNTTYYNVYHSGNLTKLSQLTNDSGFITSSASITGNAATATKLATARTIWGQSFDGSGNVNGNLILNSGAYIVTKDSTNTNRAILEMSTDNIVYLGYGSAGAGGNTHLIGKDIIFRYGTSRTEGMRITSNGSVGIGTTSPSYKLHVNGTFNATTIYQNGSSLDSLLGTKLNSSSYTAADVLAKLKTVDGAGSGLDADTLDGYHASSLIAGYVKHREAITVASAGWYKIASYSSTSWQPRGLAIFSIYCTGGDYAPFTTEFKCDMSWNQHNSYITVSGPSSLKARISRDSANTYIEVYFPRAFTTDLYLRVPFSAYTNGRTNDDWVWSSGVLTQVSVTAYSSEVGGNSGICTSGAFIGSLIGNATSATKLETPRTIWGQSFDGTGNVSGALSGVTGITMTGSIIQTVGENRFIAGSSFTDPAPGIGASTKFCGLIAQTGGNALLCTTSGNVGIGITSPSYKLHVEGAIYSSSYFKTGSSFYNNGSIELYGSTPFIDFHYGNSTADYTSRLIEGLSGQLTCTGKFRIGLGYTTSTDYNFYVSGSAYISSNLLTGGGITMYSARVLKNVVDERGLSLKELSVIKPTRYTWKDKRDERLHIGGIADDIEQVLPEVVYRTPDGVLTMDYGNAAFAIASSLIQPVISHEERIARLERENRELKEEIKRLRA